MKTIEETLKEYGALLKGHFVLTSGKHSNQYLDKTMIYPDGENISDICFEMANEMGKAFPEWANKRIEVVVGPAEGGIILAHEVAKRLSELYGHKVFSVFTEKDANDKQVLKRLSFRKIVAGSLVLIVDDVLTTGGSIMKVIREVQEAGGLVKAVAVICNRGDVHSSDIMDYQLFSLWKTDIESWPAEQCPLCQKGISITNLK